MLLCCYACVLYHVACAGAKILAWLSHSSTSPTWPRAHLLTSSSHSSTSPTWPRAHLLTSSSMPGPGTPTLTSSWPCALQGGAPLPVGWSEATDPSTGATYYYHISGMCATGIGMLPGLHVTKYMMA